MTCWWYQENWLRSFSSANSFHTCTTQREVLCTDAFTRATNPPHFSGERWSSRVQQTEAGSCGDHVIFFSTHRHRCRLLSPQTLLTASKCNTTFSQGDFCFLCVWRALEALSTPPLTRSPSGRFPAEPLTQTFVFTHAPPVQRMSKQLFSVCPLSGRDN